MFKGTERTIHRDQLICKKALLVAFAMLACTCAFVEAQSIGDVIQSVDSIDPEPASSDQARLMLRELSWNSASFDVTLELADKKNGDVLVRFPTPRLSNDDTNDRVAMEWYQAKGADKQPVVAPAAIIVHESGSKMVVGRLIAGALSRKGIHAFMIQLPHYGKRRTPNQGNEGDQLVARIRQGIVDVRRAKDAVARFPLVDANRISIQGTSLGGFVASISASLDGCFHRVFLLLSGGDLASVIRNGKREAARLHEEMLRSGLNESEIDSELASIEPLVLANRLKPSKTWLISGEYDDVVPLSNAKMLANAIGLDSEHHMLLHADHYSGILFLPIIIDQMAEEMRSNVSAENELKSLQK
jgi:hypothetical protein